MKVGFSSWCGWCWWSNSGGGEGGIGMAAISLGTSDLLLIEGSVPWASLLSKMGEVLS